MPMSKEKVFEMVRSLGMTTVESGLVRMLLDDPRFVGDDPELVTKEDLQKMLDYVRANVPEELRKGEPFGAN